MIREKRRGRTRAARGVFVLALIFVVAIGAPARAQTDRAAAMEKYSDDGQRALAAGNFAAAEAAYEKLRDLSPETAEIHVNLGLIYYSERKYQPAVAELRRGLKLNPNLQKAQPLLA